MLDGGGIVDAEVCGSTCVGLRRSKETVVERP